MTILDPAHGGPGFQCGFRNECGIVDDTCVGDMPVCGDVNGVPDSCALLLCGSHQPDVSVNHKALVAILRSYEMLHQQMVIVQELCTKMT